MGLVLAIAVCTQATWAAPVENTTTTTPQDRVATIRACLLNPRDGHLLVVAHRGHHHTAPENSLAAIEDAIAIGVHMVELDVRKTSDGELVLMHDATINRTTTGSGKVAEKTYAELQKVQLEHGARPTGQRVPTLKQAFEAARGKIMLNPDLKAVSLEEVVQAARDADMLDHCLFKFSLAKLDEKQIAWLQANPDVLFMPIVASLAEAQTALNTLNSPAMEMVFQKNGGWRCDNRLMLSKLRHGKMRLWVNSLADRPRGSNLGDRAYAAGQHDVYQRLMKLGYSIIQTDLPEAVLEKLKQRALRFE